MKSVCFLASCSQYASQNQFLLTVLLPLLTRLYNSPNISFHLLGVFAMKMQQMPVFFAFSAFFVFCYSFYLFPFNLTILFAQRLGNHLQIWVAMEWFFHSSFFSVVSTLRCLSYLLLLRLLFFRFFSFSSPTYVSSSSPFLRLFPCLFLVCLLSVFHSPSHTQTPWRSSLACIVLFAIKTRSWYLCVLWFLLSLLLPSTSISPSLSVSLLLVFAFIFTATAHTPCRSR